VLDIDQDPLGRQAGRVKQEGTAEVWARPLFDRTMAVGLFNRGNATATIKVTWAELKLSGRQPVRDLWQQKDLGNFRDAFETSVPVHGAVLLKIGSPRRNR
jgi:alpha-galactosidase